MLSAKIRSNWIIGRTKWIFEYFSYLALVEYCTKWIRIKWGPGVFCLNFKIYRNESQNNFHCVVCISFNCRIRTLCHFLTVKISTRTKEGGNKFQRKEKYLYIYLGKFAGYLCMYKRLWQYKIFDYGYRNLLVPPAKKINL